MKCFTASILSLILATLSVYSTILKEAVHKGVDTCLVDSCSGQRDCQLNNSSEDPILQLEIWAIGNGAISKNVEISRESRICLSTKYIEEGDTLIEIPGKLLITPEMGRISAIGMKVAAAKSLTDSSEIDASLAYLSIFILSDRRNSSSFFQPYYNSLPNDFDMFPLFWSKEELVYLKGSPAFDAVIRRLETLKSIYHGISDAAPEFRDIATLEDFQKVMTTIISRNFMKMMVPYLDMLNHSQPGSKFGSAQCIWTFDRAKKSFRLKAQTDIPKGVPVTLTYGFKANIQLFLNYGFVLGNYDPLVDLNPNYFQATLRMNPSDKFYQLKRLLYSEKDELRASMFHLNNQTKDYSLLDLVSYLRVSLSKKSQLIAIFAKRLGLTFEQMATLVDFKRPNSKDNLTVISSLLKTNRNQRKSDSNDDAYEKKVLKWLGDYCNERLSKYATSFEFDTARLMNGSGSAPFEKSKDWNALILVRGEKEVLLFYRDYARHAETMIGS